MALDFTLLTEKQIWGSDALNVLKEENFGPQVAPTDLAVLLGGAMADSMTSALTAEGDLTCVAWSASSAKENCVCGVNIRGEEGWYATFEGYYSVRPVLPPSEVSKIGSIKEKGEIFRCRVVEYGEYPQRTADKRTSEELEKRFNDGSLCPTGKKYTFNAKDWDDIVKPFEATSYPEYELDGIKYIRVLGNPYSLDSSLATGEPVEEGKPYWVEVRPIEWLMDPNGTMVSKKCLFSAIRFDTKREYDGNFKKTFMKHYLDTYFAKEIEPSELMADRERRTTLEGLKARLAEASDLDRARADTKPARTPERTELAARMKRVRRERDVIRAAADQARETGDDKLFEAIAEIAQEPIGRAKAVMNKYYVRRAERRAARAKSGRG